jgi:deoxyribonuclease (pyrimidine dimer)
MTRINVGINPRILTQPHLIAEHREIKRVPNTIKSGKAKIEGIPSQFTLGTGHVKWSYDKQLFLLKRYRDIRDECLRRGYKVTNYESAWDGVPKELMNDYSPTERDKAIVMERLVSKDRVYLIQNSPHAL